MNFELHSNILTRNCIRERSLILKKINLMNLSIIAGAEFWNRRPKRAMVHSDRAQGEQDGVLTSLILSNCTSPVIHTHNRHFRSIYELKY